MNKKIDFWIYWNVIYILIVYYLIYMEDSKTNEEFFDDELDEEFEESIVKNESTKTRIFGVSNGSNKINRIYKNGVAKL